MSTHASSDGRSAANGLDIIGNEFECLQDYSDIEHVGGGTFGEVVKATHLPHGRTVALKRVFATAGTNGELPQALLRELHALQTLQHENIVGCNRVFKLGGSMAFEMEYCCTDLDVLLRSAKSRSQPVPPPVAKLLLRQLLSGIAACHATGTLHRDIKPSNLLLSEEGVLKLADFGQARQLNHVTAVDNGAAAPQEPYTAAVATRWYRAPELLLGSTTYGGGVDIWAAACTFAELLGGEPLLQGESDIDQIGRVARLFGGINPAQWPGVTALPDYGKLCFRPLPPTPLAELLPPSVPPGALQVLQAMLQLDPARRPTAAQALQHPYFTAAAEEGAEGSALLRQEVQAAVAFAAAEKERQRASMAAFEDELAALFD